MSAPRVWEALWPQDRALLARLASLAPQARLALVGGAVRDALLGLTPLDLDVVVDGGSVEALARESGKRFAYHPQYDNATLHLEGGRTLDLVRARGETYAFPGASPTPFPADLETDLARRDFSVNALALDLREGTLLDPLDGQEDLARRTLRPLHPRSFADDPSRLARGARLAARLNFDLHPEGRAQVPDARRYAPHTPRLRGELPLAFHEPLPGAVFARLREWGAPDVFGADAAEVLLRLDEARAAGEGVAGAVYAAAWLAAQGEADARAAEYALGEKPLRLLERARGDACFPHGSPEAQLRRALELPEPPAGLSGADVVALGVPPGPRVGRALAHLAALRRAGQVAGKEDEARELKAYLERARYER